MPSRSPIVILDESTINLNLPNKTEKNFDIIALTYAIGVPCKDGEPCLILAHHLKNECPRMTRIEGTKRRKWIRKGFKPKYGSIDKFIDNYKFYVKEKQAQLNSRTHKMIHEKEGGYKCENCNKYVTLTKSNLTRHKKVCKGSNHLKCPNCEYTPKKKCNLTRHLKTVHKKI